MSDLTQPHAPVPTTPVRAGAAVLAPTAPHATPPDPGDRKRRRSGPELFWRGRRVGLVLALCLVASVATHFAVSPWTLMPQATLEIHDLEGELTIPVDLLEGPTAPPPPTPPPATAAPPPVSPLKGEGPGAGAPDAGPRRHRDAGPPHDAAVVDAEARDGGPPTDAGDLRSQSGEGSDGGVLSDAMVAGGNAAKDAAGIIEGVAAGPKLVEVLINVAVIRTNPVGAHLGPLLRAIPQWDEFMAGTDVDPIKDAEWILIFGPSLLHTENDAVLLRYNMSDARAAKNLEVLSHKDINGGGWDAGVPGVKAWRGHADRAWRIFLLPRPHYAMMVPQAKANEAARAFSRVEPHVPLRAGEAVRFTVENVSHAIPQLPPGLAELRAWVVPRADGGADAYAEIDAPDEDAADATAKRVRELNRQQNSIAVKLVTHGVLDALDVTSEGSMVKAHLPASAEQLGALYDLVSALLGVNTPPMGGDAPPASTGPAAVPVIPSIPPLAPAPAPRSSR